ncbi:hypothetical protein [Bifidobacterium anseris]|uniref:hypothetical protein n=1 Tax=Bifidobacterium anseris TaxID=2020963 RepID=UPI001054C576|nr:hypothetical protein [Bifidobacterium anseris]
MTHGKPFRSSPHAVIVSRRFSLRRTHKRLSGNERKDIACINDSLTDDVFGVLATHDTTRTSKPYISREMRKTTSRPHNEAIAARSKKTPNEPHAYASSAHPAKRHPAPSHEQGEHPIAVFREYT